MHFSNNIRFRKEQLFLPRFRPVPGPVSYTHLGRHGKLTPIWWTDGNTQFGLLKTISVDGSGTYLDGVMKSEEITIDTLALSAQPYISFKIEIKKDAKHVGGINIFGKSYGDYPQNIVMHVEY